MHAQYLSNAFALIIPISRRVGPVPGQRVILKVVNIVFNIVHLAFLLFAHPNFALVCTYRGVNSFLKLGGKYIVVTPSILSKSEGAITTMSRFY